MFGDSFRKRLSPLQDDAIRQALQDAILAHDPATFRAVLGKASSDLLTEERLYGVLTLIGERMVPILVDHTGQSLPAGYVIRAGMPIDMLNVDFRDGRMVATIDGEIYQGPVGEMESEDDK